GVVGGAGRHPDARHLLRGGSLPLRDGGGRAVRRVRRGVLLAAEVDRPHVQRDARQAAFLADADLLQHDLLRAALPRPCRHAAAHPRLPADVRDLEQDLLDRRVRLRPVAAAAALRGARLHPQRRARPAEAVGRRRLARVDAPADAGALPHVRDAARPQVSAVMSKNAKTALVLASIALAFFFGIIAKYWLLR